MQRLIRNHSYLNHRYQVGSMPVWGGGGGARGQNLEHLVKVVFLCWSFLEFHIPPQPHPTPILYYPTLPYPTLSYPTPPQPHPTPTLPFPYLTLPYSTLPYPPSFPYLTLPYLPYPTPYPTPTLSYPYPALPYPLPYPTPALPYPIIGVNGDRHGLTVTSCA